MFAAAGPLANFAAMIALHGLYLLIAMLPADGVTLSVRDLVGGFTEGLALWSGAIGVFNLIPFRTRSFGWRAASRNCAEVTQDRAEVVCCFLDHVGSPALLLSRGDEAR